jgi:Putative addiction module component
LPDSVQNTDVSLVEIKAQAVYLTPDERAELAEFSDSLDESLTPAWQVEVEHRWQSVRAGTAKMMPCE